LHHRIVRSPSRPTAPIYIPAHHSYRRDRPQLRQHLWRTHIPRMQDLRNSAQGLHRLRPQQPMRVRNNAHHSHTKNPDAGLRVLCGLGCDCFPIAKKFYTARMFMFRTRFKKQIVAEFLPPARERKRQRVILLCDGMPGMPRKQGLAQFLAGKGYWVFYPRWRGAWESDGEFLQKSPEQDLRDVMDELPKGVREAAFGRRFKLSPDEIFVIGGSFGGGAAILASRDERVKKVIANCPVV